MTKEALIMQIPSLATEAPAKNYKNFPHEDIRKILEKHLLFMQKAHDKLSGEQEEAIISRIDTMLGLMTTTYCGSWNRRWPAADGGFIFGIYGNPLGEEERQQLEPLKKFSSSTVKLLRTNHKVIPKRTKQLLNAAFIEFFPILASGARSLEEYRAGKNQKAGRKQSEEMLCDQVARITPKVNEGYVKPPTVMDIDPMFDAEN